MTFRLTTIERAFELARTGDYSGIGGIRAQLTIEGYSLAQLEGPSLMRQLKDLCAASVSADQDGTCSSRHTR